MADSRSISGTVKTETDSGSPERVAENLARQIASIENLYDRDDFRAVFLDLYAECLYATRGYRKFQ